VFNHVDHDGLSNNANGLDCWYLRQYKPLLCCPTAALSGLVGAGGNKGPSIPATPQGTGGEGSVEQQPVQPRPFVSRHEDRISRGEWHWYCCLCTPMTTNGFSLARVAWDKRGFAKTLREGVPLQALEEWATSQYDWGSAEAPSPSNDTLSPSIGSLSRGAGLNARGIPAHAFDAIDTVGMQQHPNHQVHNFLLSRWLL
jgi:hypothetical protein